MKRKVVKHGPATFIISLPNKWVKEFGINKGDELEVEERGNSINVTTQKGKELGEVEVDISGLDKSSIVLVIRSLYKLGYDKITLNFKNQLTPHYRTDEKRTVLSVIHEEVNRLVGLEVIKQKEDFCIIKSLSVMSFSEFEPTLRRNFLMLIDVSNDLLIGAQKKDPLLLQTIYEKHNTITKFISFCVRLLNKKGYPEPKKTLLIYEVLVILDKILDVIKNTSRSFIKLKPTLSKKAIDIIKNVHQMIVAYYELYYKFDNKKVIEISDLRDNIIKGVVSNIGKLSKEEIIVITQLEACVNLVLDLIETRIALND